VSLEESKRKVLLLLSRRGETTKTYLQKALFTVTSQSLEDSMIELLTSKYIFQSSQNPESYQITRNGEDHLRTILENERRSLGNDT